MLEGFRHHLVKCIGSGRGVDVIALEDDVAVNGADAVAENVYLQLFNRGETVAAAVETGYFQRSLVGIFINKVAERVKAGAFQRTAENFKVPLSVVEKMVAKIAVIFALLRLDIVIQRHFVVGVHHVVFIFKVAVEGGAADSCLLHDHIHGNFVEIYVGYKSVESGDNSIEGTVYHLLSPMAQF